MVLTPQMQRVEHGRETKQGTQPLWDCTQPAGQCYQRLLNSMGIDMLVGSAQEGQLSSRLRSGLDQFMRPQTAWNIHNMEDTHCHMPSRQGFPVGSPYARLVGDNKWYTTIKLGKDKDGKEVREKAHVLITAARFGVPNTLFQKGLDKSEVHQALHLANCPHHHGGCNNPMHLRWGLPKENKLDQSFRRIIGVQVGKPKVASPPKGFVVGSRVTRSQAKAKSKLVTL